MTAEEILKSSEKSALDNNQIISRVNGKVPNAKKIKKSKSLGVLGFIMALLVGFAIFFSSGNLIPSAVSERLIEETDVQYADAVESKKLVFQQALYNGDLPENTVAILKQNGVEVEKTDNGQMVLKMNNKTITADTFITEVNSDVNLYNAFNNATYDRAAYYYDESAKKVFKKIGTNRNNYTSDSSFDEVMDSLIGKGSKVEVNNVMEVEKEKDGKTVIEYESAGEVAKSSAVEIIDDLNARGEEARKYQSLLLRCNGKGEVSGGLYENHQPHPQFKQLTDQILGQTYSYSPNGFFQINLPVYEQALEEIKKHISTDKVLDLYAGVGTIGLSVARDKQLTLVECDKSAYAELINNSKGINNINTILNKSEDTLKYVTPEETVILDPPRAGCDQKLINKLLEVEPKTIIYLSCSPVTQARDIKNLLKKYQIKTIKAFNFFPHTPHIENLVILSKSC